MHRTEAINKSTNPHISKKNKKHMSATHYVSFAILAFLLLYLCFSMNPGNDPYAIIGFALFAAPISGAIIFVLNLIGLIAYIVKRKNDKFNLCISVVLLVVGTLVCSTTAIFFLLFS